MTFSERCATRLVPLLARIVLCAAFLPAGWQKVFTTTTFTHDESNSLAMMGVGDAGLDWNRLKATGPGWKTSQEAGAVAPPAHSSTMTARTLYRVALASDANDLPYPAAMAWLVGIGELGCALLLGVGLCTRLGALVIALIMAGAFWTTSRHAIAATGWWALGPVEYFHFTVQTCLFALSLGVLLTGPGCLSFDGYFASSPKGKRSGSEGSSPAKAKDSR